MKKKVLLIGTLDTKGEEFGYLKKELEKNSVDVLLLDAGVLGDPVINADISSKEVASMGGCELSILRKNKDRGQAIEVMRKGIIKLTEDLFSKGLISGIMGMGGGGGTNLACASMQVVPVGFPKLVISTLACGDTSSFIKERDITMVFSVADILGLNKITKSIISNAAAAMAGMVKQNVPNITNIKKKPLISATMMGVTTECVSICKKRLEENDYEIIAFAASGSGGRAMENIISDDLVEGVLDITTTEIMNTIVGGVFPAGPERFTIAGKKGIPQILSCGALDFVNFWTGGIPEKFKNRKFYQHNPIAVLMRTTKEENSEAGRVLAARLNQSFGPTVFFVPLKGFSTIDIEGKNFYDPEADMAFIDSLEKNISPNVELIKCNNHINDPEFAIKMVDCLISKLKLNV